MTTPRPVRPPSATAGRSTTGTATSSSMTTTATTKRRPRPSLLRPAVPCCSLFASVVVLLLLLGSGPGPMRAGAGVGVKFCAAERDGHAPWGDGRPPRGFRMWWRDPSNVLEDLDQFSTLYVKAHGCVWSEYGIDDHDDDGENRDGDEDWYQGRTLPFRANVAYSLYGVLKGQFRINKCSKSTYINTFVTFMGADALLNTIGRHGLGNDDDAGYGNAYCAQIDMADLYRDRDRALESGDNNNDDSLASTTMGCALNSDKFVMATFADGYCDGNKFMNVTDSMRSYNRAMKGARCEKIWDNGSARYAGDDLLRGSSSCDTSYYGNRCPDPYGRKKKYAKLASGGNNYGESARRFFLYFARGLAWILLVAGLVLLAAAFWIKRRYGRSRRRSSRRKKKVKRRRSSKSKRRSRGGEGEEGEGDDGTYDGTYAESEYTGTIMSGESSKRSRASSKSKSRSKSSSKKTRDYAAYDVDPEEGVDSPGRSRTSATTPRSTSSRSTKEKEPTTSSSRSGSKSRSKRDKVRQRLGMDSP
mmetsp:Transcript_24771/g.50821  ORF Transcript_24771/g.50821 Transcript_24771/m.50821 type:complete len:530 (+) Transcript_24771:246-1835(+)